MKREGDGSRPGGRSGRVLEAVYEAVGELVGQGTARLTFPVIADRAGVNPTTLYRRWSDVDELLEEVAVAALTRDGDVLPDTGTLAGDLAAWAQVIVDDITRPERTRYLRVTVSARLAPVVVCPVWEKRREQAGELISRASKRGQPVPTVDQVLDHVIAPLYHHVAFALPVDRAYAARLVDDVLTMAV